MFSPQSANTPLHYASSAEVASVLLAAGAEVDANNTPMFSLQYTLTPLHAAAKRGHSAVASVLLGAGAAVDAQDRVSARAAAEGGGLEGRSWVPGVRAAMQGGARLCRTAQDMYRDRQGAGARQPRGKAAQDTSGQRRTTPRRAGQGRADQGRSGQIRGTG